MPTRWTATHTNPPSFKGYLAIHPRSSLVLPPLLTICHSFAIDAGTFTATIEPVNRNRIGLVMLFAWDEAKNDANIRHHGIDFADVPSMFLAPMLTDSDDRVDYGEERWISIGMLVRGITVIVWTERAGDVIRIISARKANKDERRRYETAFTD